MKLKIYITPSRKSSIFWVIGGIFLVLISIVSFIFNLVYPIILLFSFLIGAWNIYSESRNLRGKAKPYEQIIKCDRFEVLND